MISKLALLYCPEMDFSLCNDINPMGIKGRLVVEDIIRQQLPVDIIEPVLMHRDTLKLAHDPSYIDALFALECDNGLGNRDSDILKSLHWIASASCVAAKEALTRGMACIPTGACHHAHYDHGQGLCTFNGLMIAIQYLRQNNLIKKCAIIDTDLHYGDGTQNIIERLGLQTDVWHLSMGQKHQASTGPEVYLERLRIVKSELEQFKPDIILYQSGGDVHVDDLFGGVLDSFQMYTRDCIVFNTAKELDVPIFFNFSGGYQPDPQGHTFSKLTSFFVNAIRAALSLDYKTHPIEDGPRNRFRFIPGIDEDE